MEQTMKQIASFTVNHDKLEKGMYISRIDGDVVTYDIRMKKPNGGDYLSNGALHTFEHLFATYARNSRFSGSVLYVGPMGCRTGFYLLLSGDYQSDDIVPLLRDMFVFIRDYEGEVPGACARDCGNYLDMNLPMAKWLAGKYLREALDALGEERLNYTAD